MSFLAPEVQQDVVLYGVGTALPAEIPPVRPDADHSLPLLGSYGTHSRHTTLYWAWATGKQQPLSGELAWPEDQRRAGYEHAVKLLQIAEAGFVEGCPKARLPPGILDAKHVKPAHISKALFDTLVDLSTTKLCPQ